MNPDGVMKKTCFETTDLLYADIYYYELYSNQPAGFYDT